MGVGAVAQVSVPETIHGRWLLVDGGVAVQIEPSDVLWDIRPFGSAHCPSGCTLSMPPGEYTFMAPGVVETVDVRKPLRVGYGAGWGWTHRR